MFHYYQDHITGHKMLIAADFDPSYTVCQLHHLVRTVFLRSAVNRLFGFPSASTVTLAETGFVPPLSADQ